MVCDIFNWIKLGHKNINSKMVNGAKVIWWYLYQYMFVMNGTTKEYGDLNESKQKTLIHHVKSGRHSI